MKKIGLFGGSFNPIHNGHLAIGRTMLRTQGLDEVWFMVSPQNPWKVNADLLDENVRLATVRAALEGEAGLVASDYEFHLPRPSYTWNTLQNLGRDYPDCEFTLIIGGDNWDAFGRWAHSDEILRGYHVAVFPREGAAFPAALPPNVDFVRVPLVNVTSTMLRQMVRDGKDITPYVPGSVATLVAEQYCAR